MFNKKNNLYLEIVIINSKGRLDEYVVFKSGTRELFLRVETYDILKLASDLKNSQEKDAMILSTIPKSRISKSPGKLPWLEKPISEEEMIKVYQILSDR